MRELPTEAIFPRSALRGRSWSDSAINRALVSERLFQVRKGWLAATRADTERRTAIAAALANPATVLSHRSAALMHGLPIVEAKATRPELTVPPRGPGNIKHAHVHRATLYPDDIVLIDSVPVTSVARSLIDLGRHRPTACAVAAIDHALHNELVTMDELEEVLRGLRLPPPEPQVLAIDSRGYPAGRFDFYWDEYGVAGEADGKGKYRNDPEEHDREKQRQELLEDHRVVFARWGWDEPVRHPQYLKAKVLNAFERGAARDRSGLARLWAVRSSELRADGTRRK